MDPGLVGRHPDDTEEWIEPHLLPRVGATRRRVSVERPEQGDRLAVLDAEPPVERRVA